MGKLELLFKKENVEYVELENELTKNEMLMNIVDNGTINESSVIDFYYKEDNMQLHSYTVDYDNRKYLFYEKIDVTKDHKDRKKYGKYKSVEIFKVIGQDIKFNQYERKRYYETSKRNSWKIKWEQINGKDNKWKNIN